MKIGIAQIRPIKGNIPANIEVHKKLINLALELHADAIFFPELSLTGYEPKLANELAFSQYENGLEEFQRISNQGKIIIGAGLPTRTETKIRISMLIFEPNQPGKIYSKQYLHADEIPYFEKGIEHIIITKDKIKIAPAICYESLQPVHSENAFRLGANIYLATVAKSESGVVKAFNHYPAIAKQYGMPVLMSNCIGFCDDFLSAGNSAVWKKDGKLAGQLNAKTEGILIFDTETENIIESTL